MGRSLKETDQPSDTTEIDRPERDHALPGHSLTCPRCQALEARVAELEAAAALEGPGPSGESASLLSIPTVEFKALRLLPYGWGEGWQLRPGPARRNWMDDLPHAYKCLPLVLANQWGWQLLCPTDVVATWDGTQGLDGLRIEVPPQFEPAIKSQFGAGIITFSPPWLFRTPPGWNLYLKGPTNRWKPNCVPLEGVIETWWLNYTFTLNWKIVEAGTVVFRQGESLGQLLPVPHLTFQNATATEAPIGLLEPKASEELVKWQEKRRQIAGQRDNVHHMYRKAEGVDEHFHRVSVPPLRIINTDEAIRLKASGEQSST
jgi:Family of unknown function (DUF6065)